MKIEAKFATGGMMITGVTSLTVDGVPFGGPVQQPVAGPPLTLFYNPDGDAADGIKRAVLLAQPKYVVRCDGTVVEGSGTLLPEILYGTTENQMWIKCANPEHPYFQDHALTAGLTAERVDAIETAMPAVKAHVEKMAAAPADAIDPLKVWETGPNYTDPPTMRFWLNFFGYTVNGRSPQQQGDDYAGYYYGFWGRQAPQGPEFPMTPTNHEVITDAQLAAYKAQYRQRVQ